MNLKAWIKLQDNTVTTDHIKMEIKVQEKVTAVFVDALVPLARFPYKNINYLHSEFGVCIEIKLPEEIKGYMADYLYSEFWCKPFFGTDISKIPEDTQALVYEKSDGLFGVILPVCSEQYKCTLEGDEGKIKAKLYSWCYGMNQCKALAFLQAEGKDPFELMQKCVKYGLELLGNDCVMREERDYPELFEYLGWCSWDALQIRVSEEGLLEKCKEFKEKNIPVKWIILDDMWADVKGINEVRHSEFGQMIHTMHRSTLYSFQADAERFPNGLMGCIDKIKQAYDLKIGMWHPTTGYWGGLDPDGDIVKEYKKAVIEIGDGRHVHGVELEKAYEFYHAFHSYLKGCGADFVKIDNQSFIRGYLKGIAPVGKIGRNLHKAIETSTQEAFDNRLINCMGMAQENMWNRPRSTISRASNDFLPDNKEWFSNHILQCAYNSFIQGQFLWCDWDMWWTNDGQAVKNSVLRAISGGPIYISDKIKQSEKTILDPLIFSDGRILRCDRPAMPTTDCLINDPELADTPFKIWNTCNGSGIIAVFNLNKEDNAVKGKIAVSDVGGLFGESFAIYEHFSKEVRIISGDESVEIELKNRDDFKLYIIVPVVDGFAPIGLSQKFISPGSIVSWDEESFTLYEAGSFAYVKDGKLYSKKTGQNVKKQELF